MSKKQVVLIIILSVLASWIFVIFPGRYLEAKVSTWPLLNKWKILSPEAPIVITNRETVRVSDNDDAQAAIQQVKSKLSLVVLVNGLLQTTAGAAVNLTSDGVFATASSTFAGKAPGTYYVALNDGTTAVVAQKVYDPATSLVFFKAALSNVPVASLGDSGSLSPGDKVVFTQSSLSSFDAKAQVVLVISAQTDIASQIFQSDYPSRSFTAAPAAALLPGEPVVDTNAEVVGLFGGNQIISSDVIKQAQSLYFSNSQNIIRPSFGFSYSMLGKAESSLYNLPQGAKIISVEPDSAGQKAGLLDGDVITSFGGQSLDEGTNLEEILQSYKPGDEISVVVSRKGQPVDLSLTVLQLK